MGNRSVFQFIENDDGVDNLGVINGQTEAEDTNIVLEPAAGSYEALFTALAPDPGVLRLKIKGTDRYVYVPIVAKANFA